ncbi:hypothetical protein O181_008024 [Austropuccinia psidii MF-1]|uniref:Uncharacterized protein n=1 Tax=Austropuccinia psidii MF-1 TaxID=1389203 RepID=A0A9Q3GIG6_9BASI|nr:hypothetical protein [Austropuccinia psidii MF-1]
MGVDCIIKSPQTFHQLIKKHEVQDSRFVSIKVEIFSDLDDWIQKEAWKDKDNKEILKQLVRDSPSGKLSTELQSVQKVVKEELESERRQFKNSSDRNKTIPPEF